MQEMHYSFITLYNLISLVNNSKPKAWDFWQSIIHVTGPILVYSTYHYNGPYLLLVPASYFILYSIHARFSSTLSIDCKWCWGVNIFELVFQCLFRSYRVNNKVINVSYILKYYDIGILFVILHEGCVSYTH